MTVLTPEDRIAYLGDGIIVDYTYDFEIPRSEEVVVTLDGIPTTAYTILGIGDPAGGMVTFTAAPADLTAILISRDVPLTQLTDLLPYDPLPAETLESTFDRIVFMIQKVAGLVTGSYTKSIDTPADVSAIVPKPEPGLFWKWDATGKVIEYTNILNLAPTAIAVATDSEMIAGVNTSPVLMSPFQTKLSVQTHESPPIVDIADVQWVEVVDNLPPSPISSTLYLVRQ